PVDEPDDHVAAGGRLLREALEGGKVVLDELGTEDQVLGRIAGDRELREEHDIGAFVRGARRPVGHPRHVPVEVADSGVQLAERDPDHVRKRTGTASLPGWAYSTPPISTLYASQTRSAPRWRWRITEPMNRWRSSRASSRGHASSPISTCSRRAIILSIRWTISGCSSRSRRTLVSSLGARSRISSYRPSGFSVTITCWPNASRTSVISLSTVAVQSGILPAAGEEMDFSRRTMASCSVLRCWRASLSAWLSSSLGSIPGTLAGRVFRKQTGVGAAARSAAAPTNRLGRPFLGTMTDGGRLRRDVADGTGRVSPEDAGAPLRRNGRLGILGSIERHERRPRALGRDDV